jgi:hypothetical protein
VLDAKPLSRFGCQPSLPITKKRFVSTENLAIHPSFVTGFVDGEGPQLSLCSRLG